MTTTATTWLAKSNARDRTLAEEEFILDVTEKIWGLLDDKQYNRSDLASKLGTSRSNITQMLNGSRNMTLRTLASIAYVLDTVARVEFGDREEVGYWHDVADALMIKKAGRRGRDISTEEFSLRYQTGAANIDWTDIDYRKSA